MFSLVIDLSILEPVGSTGGGGRRSSASACTSATRPALGYPLQNWCQEDKNGFQADL